MTIHDFCVCKEKVSENKELDTEEYFDAVNDLYTDCEDFFSQANYYPSNLDSEEALSARDFINIADPAITQSLTHTAISNFLSSVNGVPYLEKIGGLFSYAAYSIPVVRVVRYLYSKEGRAEMSQLFTSSDRLSDFISRILDDILNAVIPIAGNMVISSFVSPEFSLKVKEALKDYLGDAAGWLFQMDDNEEERRIRQFLFSAIAIAALILYYNKIKINESNNSQVNQLRGVVEVITRGLFFGHGLIQHTIDLAPKEMGAEPRSVDTRRAERKHNLKVLEFIKNSPPEENAKLSALRAAVEQKQGHLTIENLIQFYQGEEVAGVKLSKNFTTPYPGATDKSIDYHAQRLAQLHQLCPIPEPQNAFMGASAQETVAVAARQDEQEQEQMSWWRWGLSATAAFSTITFVFSSLLSFFYSKRHAIPLSGDRDTEEMEMVPVQSHVDFQSDMENGVLVNADSEETQEEQQKHSKLLRVVQIASAATALSSAAPLIYKAIASDTKNNSVPEILSDTTTSNKVSPVLLNSTDSVESITISSSVQTELNKYYDSLLIENGTDINVNQDSIEHLKEILSHLSLDQLEQLDNEVAVKTDDSDIFASSTGKKRVERSAKRFDGVDENKKKMFILKKYKKLNISNSDKRRSYYTSLLKELKLRALIIEMEIDRGKPAEQTDKELVSFKLQAIKTLFRYMQNISPATKLIISYLTDTFSDAVRLITLSINNINNYSNVFEKKDYIIVKDKIKSLKLEESNVSLSEKDIAIYDKLLELAEKSAKLYLIKKKKFTINGEDVSKIIEEIKKIKTDLSYHTITEEQKDSILSRLNNQISLIDSAYTAVKDFYFVSVKTYLQNRLKDKLTTPLNFSNKIIYQELIDHYSTGLEDKQNNEKLEAVVIFDTASRLLAKSDNARDETKVESDAVNIYARSRLESIFQTDTHLFDNFSIDDVESTELIYSYTNKYNKTEFDTATFYEYITRFVPENDSPLANRNNVDIKFPIEYQPGLTGYLKEEARNIEKYHNAMKKQQSLEEKRNNLSRLMPDPDAYLKLFLVEKGKKYSIDNLKLSDKVTFNYQYFTPKINHQPLGQAAYPPVTKVFTVQDILTGKQKQWLAENPAYNNLKSPEVIFPKKYCANLINEIMNADIQSLYENYVIDLKSNEEVKTAFYDYVADLISTHNNTGKDYYLIENCPSLIIFSATERGPVIDHVPVDSDNINPQDTPIEVISALTGGRLFFSSFRDMKKKIQDDKTLKGWFTLHYPYDYIIKPDSMKLIKKEKDYSYFYDNILQKYINDIDVIIRSQTEANLFHFFQELKGVSTILATPGIIMGPVRGFLYGSLISAGPLFALAANSDTAEERDKYLEEAGIAVAFEAGGQVAGLAFGKIVSKAAKSYFAYKASNRLISDSAEFSDDILNWVKEPGTGSLKPEWKVNDISLDNKNVKQIVINGIYYNKIYRLPDNHYYIKEADNIYQVRWDASDHTWRVVNPLSPGSHMYATPVKLGKDGHWVTHANVGLKGGSPKLKPTWKEVEHINDVSQTQAKKVRSLVWEAKDRAVKILKRVKEKVKSTNPEDIKYIDKAFEIFLGNRLDKKRLKLLKDKYIVVLDSMENFLADLNPSKDIFYQGGYYDKLNSVIFQTEDGAATVGRSDNKPPITVFVDSLVDTNKRLSYSDKKFKNFIANGLIHESYHAVSEKTKDLSYPKVHKTALDISGIVSLSEPLLRDSQAIDIIKNKDLMKKVFKDKPEIICLLDDSEKNKRELINFVKDKLEISNKRVWENPDNIAYMTTLIRYIDNNKPFYDEFVENYNLWKHDTTSPLIWNFKGSHTGDVMNFENTDIGKLRHGDISPLKERGLATGKKTKNIDLKFDFIRNDKHIQMPSSERFNIKAITEENGKLHGSMNTWKGSAVTSQANDGTVPGLWGNKFTLNDNVSFIHVVNGHSGTVAIKIPLDDLQEGMPVVITAGRLSGCSMIYAVDDNHFYAYHFGQQAGDTDWLTSRDGVASFYDTHLKLTNKVVDGLKAGEIMSNNDLVDICSKYKRCVITYYGKNNPVSGNTRITKGDENVGIFDYNEQFVEARDPRLGLSYALIVKENGRVIVKVYSEDLLFDMSEAGKFSKISGLEFTLKN